MNPFKPYNLGKAFVALWPYYQYNCFEFKIPIHISEH
jgi:hypothetical protein